MENPNRLEILKIDKENIDVIKIINNWLEVMTLQYSFQNSKLEMFNKSIEKYIKQSQEIMIENIKNDQISSQEIITYVKKEVDNIYQLNLKMHQEIIKEIFDKFNNYVKTELEEMSDETNEEILNTFVMYVVDKVFNFLREFEKETIIKNGLTQKPD